MHAEGGYDYHEIPKLTAAEVRRFMEGKRVHEKIKQMRRDASQNDGAALGRTVPRDSDEELLENYAERIDGDSGGAASLGGV